MNKMKKKTQLYWSILTILLLVFPNTSLSQAPNSTLNLGILESFGGYTGGGDIIIESVNWTGDAGTHNGIIMGFDDTTLFNDFLFTDDAVTAQCREDLLRMFIHLNDLFVDYPSTHLPDFGDGEILTPGVYCIGGSGSIGLNLTLDGGGRDSAFFVLKFQGGLSVGAAAVVTLTGGTQACNVFYLADDAIDIGTNASIKGTLFSKVGAVVLAAGAVVEGRILTLNGALNAGVNATLIRPSGTCTIPIFCRNSCDAAPAFDILGVLANLVLYTNSGIISNTSTTAIIGDVGSNAGSISGFEFSLVKGNYNLADPFTSQANIDLDNAYNSLMALPNTVPSEPGVIPEVLTHGPSFGADTLGGEIIYAGVYFIAGAGSLFGTLILDAQNDTNALFVLKFGGAFTVAVLSKMILINGARPCNVFFIAGATVVTGDISIAANAFLKGTFISHAGFCDAGTSLFLEGRLLSTIGAVSSYSSVLYTNPEYITSEIFIPDPLPIDLLSFTGECLPIQIRLNWETTSETNNDYFSIERSTDGINWSEIGKINGAGNSSASRKYFLDDENQYNEISYYRLKQHDFSGVARTFSPISVKNCIDGNDALSIYPNPAEKAINILFNGEVEQVINTTIVDLFGRNVYQSSKYQSVINIENFEDGIYFLQLLLKSGNITRKFVVSK
jgi:hypothetical protein